MEKALRHLFVYGTLRLGFPHPYATRLQREAEFLGRAHWAAQLYDLGPYPGGIPSESSDHQIVGDLFALSSTTQLFHWLDLYEGCSPTCPAPHEFTREAVEVVTMEGQKIQAWTYVYRGDLSNATPVTIGDYATCPIG